MTFSEIVAKIDRACNTNSTSYTLANKAIDVNLALRDLIAIALRNKKVNYDDPNQTENPFLTTNLVSGQRDYYFALDEQSNIILAFNKIMVADAAGVFYALDRVNQELDSGMEAFFDGQNAAGQPTRYDQTGMAVFLDPVPNYSVSGGIKAFIDRTPSYFISSDTTKTAGTDELVQSYLWLRPSYEYCRDKEKKNAEQLFRDMNIALRAAEDRLLATPKDTPRRFVPARINCR